MMETAPLLNDEQRDAVDHVDGPALVLAGAGSGKTRVVTYRILSLLQKGVPASEILAVTFTNKAAQEMRERVMRQVSEPVLITTFHSLGARILRESITFLGYAQNFTIYDADDSLRLMKTCLNDLDSGSKDRVKQAKTLRGLISSAKNELVAPDDVDTSELVTVTEQLFPSAYAMYQRKLREFQAVDFDDLLYLPAQLFREHPDVLETYRNVWKYLLIDEYQDTNGAQYQLVRMLVEKSRNLFVVGDPDQSIYSWRGANMKNILTFGQDYPGAKIIRLEQNYRSQETILRAANAVIEQNCNRYDKELWSDRGVGSQVQIFSGYTERDEAQFVVNKIRAHRSADQMPLRNMVIFYRTNFQSRQFEDVLLRNRIPYVIVGGLSFYQRKEIKDIIAYLRMVQSGADYVSFARVINLPKRGIGNTSVEKIRMAAEALHISVFEVCRKLVNGDPDVGFKLSARQKAGIGEFVTLIETVRAVAETGSLRKTVEQIATSSGYFGYLSEDPESQEDRKENIQELISKAAEWDIEREESSLDAFLEELSLKSSLDEKGVGQDCVHLMTLHNGKGLEFPVAFLCGMEEQLFPHASSMESPDQLEEERRLCYVGMTRAMDYLYMTCVSFRTLWGATRPMRRSRFLGEIPAEYVRFVSS
jgi:DNA helicase-2/ATP-dependent DNA helicase PcrA